MSISTFYKSIKKIKTKAFISLELVFVLAISGFLLSKIFNLVYEYIHQFYIFYTLLIMINSYTTNYIPIKSNIEEIQIETNDKQIIFSGEKNLLNNLSFFLKNKIILKNKIFFNQNNLILEIKE